MGPIPHGWFFRRQPGNGRKGTHGDLCDDGGRDCSDVAVTQHTANTAGKPERLEETRKDLPGFRGSMAFPTPLFQTPSLQDSETTHFRSVIQSGVLCD